MSLSRAASSLKRSKLQLVNVKELADHVTREPWDVACDLLLTIGRNNVKAFVEEMRARGQRNLIVCVTGDEPFPELPGVDVVRNDLQLASRVLAITGPMPKNCSIQLLPPVGETTAQHIAIALNNAVTTLAEQRATIETLGPKWKANGTANAESVKRLPDFTAVHMPKIPAVIVSPGPSLSKNIHLLKQVKGRALILCGSHSLTAIRNAGCPPPDVVMVTDPQPLSKHFNGYPIEDIEALVLAATSDPELFKLPARRIFTCAANGALDDWIYGDGRAVLEGGGSVSTSCLALAIRWGCSPLILIGQDLSFAADGKVYCGESDDKATAVSMVPGAVEPSGTVRMEGHKLPGYFGGEVSTNWQMSAYWRWFGLVGKLTKIINSTEGGASIPNTEQIPFATAIARHIGGRVDITPALNAAFPAARY